MTDRILLADECGKIRGSGRKIVYTNGCFDILHAGHIELLRRARRMGDYLLVGLNSDASVARLKGPGRPVNSVLDRLSVLEAIKYVDRVDVFDEDTPLELIMVVRPDVLVKGADYGAGRIVGEPEVLSWGGQVHRVDLLPGRSTTSMLQAATGVRA